MAEDPKAVFRMISSARAVVDKKQRAEAGKQAHDFLCSKKGTAEGVCYYPGCGSDLEGPLKHLSDRCDTFVFCDWISGGTEAFVNGLNGLTAPRPKRRPDDAPDLYHFPLKKEDVKALACMGQFLSRFVHGMRRELAEYLANPASAKGHYAEFWVKPGTGRRKFVRVFWLEMEALNAYCKLFAQNRTAPRILCIKNWGQNEGGEWANLGLWQEHLGKVVRTSRHKPDFLVSCEGDHDWPWKVRVDEFGDWGDRPVILWSRKKPASPPAKSRKRNRK